jgi:hypothetical protein
MFPGGMMGHYYYYYYYIYIYIYEVLTIMLYKAVVPNLLIKPKTEWWQHCHNC